MVKYDSAAVIVAVGEVTKGKMITVSQLEQLVIEKKLQLS
jgi:hypothetical protein